VSSLEYAVDRIQAFLAEVRRLDECEFPYEHSQAALHKIGDLFKKKLERLEQFDEYSDPAIVKQECTLSLDALFVFVPLLGFVLRSTNVRNAFEVFGPLLRLARDVLEPGTDVLQRKTRLVLSSEWDYSPFVYREIPALPGFVLIGLPAPESSNPLLIPLAGHELGHSLWASLGLRQSYTPVAKTNVLDAITDRWEEFKQVFSPQTSLAHADLTSNFLCVQFWQQALGWALSQAEESFCDYIGLKLFGNSYLNAFAYILSPSTEGTRSIAYPNILTRVRNLINAASVYGISAPTGYESMFEDMAEPNLMQSDEFLLSVADSSLAGMVDDIIQRANDQIGSAGITGPDLSEVDRIFKRFQHVVPAEGCIRISDILCAAWQAYNTKDLWQGIPGVENHKDRNLKELVLKNIEVYEIEQILKEPA